MDVKKINELRINKNVTQHFISKKRKENTRKKLTRLKGAQRFSLFASSLSIGIYSSYSI